MNKEKTRDSQTKMTLAPEAKEKGTSMKKINWFGSIVILLSLLAGCKRVAIENGRIPSDYLESAKKMEGVYKGSFDGKNAEIEIAFDGDRPTLRYTDKWGHDILDPDCHSHIEDLNEIIVHKKKGIYNLDRADFTFYPGSCMEVEGKSIELHFSKENQVTVKIFHHNEFQERCDPTNSPYVGPQCQVITTPIYLSGVFKGPIKN